VGSTIDFSGSSWPEDSADSSIQSTLWSLIIRTRDRRDSTRIDALNRLTSAFSKSLYGYARREGRTPEMARRVVLEFMEYISAGHLGNGTQAGRDRLRTFLLSAFQEFEAVRSLRDRAGDDAPAEPQDPVDFAAAEAWLLGEAAVPTAPETTFHRAWARCIREQAHAALKRELAERLGARAAEMVIVEVAPVERRPFNPDLAPELEVSPALVLDMLRWARRRLREVIANTIRETVSSTADVEVEFWDLFKSV
jgi:hypothetical protein